MSSLVTRLIVTTLMVTIIGGIAHGAPTSPPAQTSAQSANAPTTNAWWPDKMGGWIGGIGGPILGLAGGFIGFAAGTGRWRSAVAATLVGMFCIGVICLIVGVIALLLGQPYAVWYPLCLIGVLSTILPPCIWPGIRARYAQDEFRRMSSLDAAAR